MFKVEINFTEGNLVLRATPAELYILAEHVAELRKRKDTGEFAVYFREQALLNRSARKLFAAWLLKERGLWTRIYKAVHEAAEQ